MKKLRKVHIFVFSGQEEASDLSLDLRFFFSFERTILNSRRKYVHHKLVLIISLSEILNLNLVNHLKVVIIIFTTSKNRF